MGSGKLGAPSCIGRRGPQRRRMMSTRQSLSSTQIRRPMFWIFTVVEASTLLN